MILVKNAKIVDGSGEPMRQGDLIAVDGMISAIGNFPNRKAETTIDGLGMHLIPGAIDAHTEIDHTLSLIANPEQKALRETGITTTIGGHGGVSLAPIMYGLLTGTSKWADTSKAHVDWRSMKEFRKRMNRLPLGVNFGTLVGYTTVRRDIQGGRKGDLTEREITVAERIVSDAIEEGALGISLGLAGAYGQTIPHTEALAMAHVAAKHRSPLALELRGGKTPIEAVQEAIALYRATGATIVIQKLIPDTPNKVDEKECTLACEALLSAGDGVFFEVRLARYALVPLTDLVPRATREGGIPAMLAFLKNPAERKRAGYAAIPREPEAVIAHVPRELKRLEGTTLASFSADRGLALKDAVGELMRISKMRASLLVPRAPSHLHTALMDHPRVLISGEPKLVFETADALRWPIEKTVTKICASPARVFQITKRGMLHENWHADFALMNDRYEIRSVVVNGQIYGGGEFITP